MGPLSISLPTSTTKTGVPMFADNTYVHFRLTELTSSHNEGKGDVIKFKWELIDEAASVDSQRGEGETIKPGKFGSTYFENVPLYDKNTDPANPQVPDWAVKKICARLDALLDTGDPGNKKGKEPRPEFNADLVPNLLGKSVWAMMKVKGGEYEGNEISKIMSEQVYANAGKA